MEPFVLPDTLTVAAVLLIVGIIILGSIVQVGLGLGFGLAVAPLHAAGEAGVRDAFLAVLMLPPLFAGLALSRLIRGGFDRWYRFLLLAISGVAGLLLVLRGLFA